MVSFLLNEALVCLLTRWYTAGPMCWLVLTGQFYGKFSGNVGACTVSVYQALLSPHERKPGFEARQDLTYIENGQIL